MPTNEQVLDKIKKLLALGTSSNEHEAASAVAKATKLMREHGISQAMVDNFTNEEKFEVSSSPLYEGNQRGSTWRGSLAIVLATANSCRTFWRGKSLMIFGKESDVQIVRYLFSYCEKEIDRLAAQYKRGKSFSNTYRIGCCVAIKEKLDEIEADLKDEMTGKFGDQANKAIVRINQEIIDSYASLREELKLRTKDSSYKVNDGYSLGMKDGKTINLENGKGLSKGNKQLA